MGKFGDGLIVAQWHYAGDLSIPAHEQRFDFYNVSAVPHVRIDGKYSVISAESCSIAAAVYRNWINTRLTETGGVSPVAIDGACGVTPSTLQMSVSFRLDDPVTLQSPSAYLWILESDISYAVNIQADFAIQGDWNLDNIECVACLQNMSSTGNKEMYNGARIPCRVHLAGCPANPREAG